MTKHFTLFFTTVLLLAFASCAKPKEYTCKVSLTSISLEQCDKDMPLDTRDDLVLLYSLEYLDHSDFLIQNNLDTKNIKLTPEKPGATCTLKEVHNTSLLEAPYVPKTYIYYFCEEDFQTLLKYAFTDKNNIFTENGITTTIVDFPKKLNKGFSQIINEKTPKKYLTLDNIIVTYLFKK